MIPSEKGKIIDTESGRLMAEKEIPNDFSTNKHEKEHVELVICRLPAKFINDDNTILCQGIIMFRE